MIWILVNPIGKLISASVYLYMIKMTLSKVPSKYIQALVDSYPIPISQSELARRSSVTKSAISKTRNALLELCDIPTIAIKKKLVLKSDFETFMEIFHVYFMQSKTEELFESDYAKAVLNPTEIYNKLSRALKEFSFTEYFGKEDIDWAIKLVLQNVLSFRIQKETVSVIVAALSDKIEDENLSEIIPYIQLVAKLFTNFEINIRNEEELKKTLTLRDKTYLFIKDNAVKVISKLDDVREIPNSEEKKAGIKLLTKIVERFLRKTSEEITEYLWQQAKTKGIPFLDEYKEVGTLLTISAGR